MKGCIVQHHGKLEFGSPREMNMEESFIVHFADYVDATMNKISQIKEKQRQVGQNMIEELKQDYIYSGGEVHEKCN